MVSKKLFVTIITDENQVCTKGAYFAFVRQRAENTADNITSPE